MRTIAVAIVTAGLCVAAAIADSSAHIAPAARTEWSLWAGAGLVLFIGFLIFGGGR